MPILFNQPYVGEPSKIAVKNLMEGKRFCGGGEYTTKCQTFFKEQFGFNINYLTSSCTDALEMSALLLDIKAGDEVILPSYAYPTCALAFSRQSAKIIFADSSPTHPGLDPDCLLQLISDRTKAVVVIHYAGTGYQIAEIARICRQNNVTLVEDVAQGINGYFDGKPLGNFGDLACMSFHETKNIHCGEGGLLIVNNESLADRAKILIDKGTNRSDFERGLISRYECIGLGSSFLASELQAAFLYGQLQEFSMIQQRRQNIWETYFNQLSEIEEIIVPTTPRKSEHNSHCFYILFRNYRRLHNFSNYMKANRISVCFHFQPLHRSPFFIQENTTRELPNTDYFATCLTRLPLHLLLSDDDVEKVISETKEFFKVYSE